MDITKDTDNPNPRDKANFFSVLFFGYTIDIFKKGYKKQLDVEDLYNPLKKDRSQILGDRLQRQWDKQIAKSKTSNSKASLLKALTFAFWPEYLYIAVILLIQDVGLRLIQPVLLAGMLEYFTPNTKTTKEEALWYAGGMLFTSFLSLVGMNHYVLDSMHGGLKLRASCCALIYKKALKLSKTALGDTSSGKIVNLLSNDVSRFDIVSITLHQMWISPLVALIVMYLLYREVGYAGVIGVMVVFIVTPFQSYTGKLSAIYRKQTALRTDERVRLMDEIIAGIQIIKMYAWEKPFEKVISLARRSEIKIVTKASYVRALFSAFSMFTTKCALFCTLLTMVLSGQPVTASRAFLFMSYFNILSMGMASMFVRGLSEIAELLISVQRIEGFLLNEEFVPSSNLLTDVKENGYISSKVIVGLNDVSSKWNRTISEIVLNNINLNVKKGKLIGVIGPVGSGKSALLQTILGELEIIEGKIVIDGTVSYASQEAWIFAATIRQNILFGADYNKERYKEVIRVCALERDLQQFEYGDQTIVGEKGASLSGGQKARINLARAVYRDADIYLMDDPLSAVDIHVSKVLYEECINKFLAQKTRILVTHQVHYLKNCDHIIVFKNGYIEDEGTFNELANSNTEYSQLLTAEPKDEATPQNEPQKTEDKPENKFMRQLSKRSRKESVVSIVSHLALAEAEVEELLEEDEDEESDEEDYKVDLKVMQEETSKGKVGGSLFFKYLNAGGNWCSVFTVISLILMTQIGASGIDYWVNYFVNIQEYKDNILKTNQTLEGLPLAYQWSTETCLYIYGAAVIGLFIISLSRTVFFYNLAMDASRNLHALVFKNVIGATMRFFDTNPSGRILNRFAKDMGAVDELLPRIIIEASQMVLQVVGSMILVAIVSPYFIILLVVLLVIFGYMRKIYLKTSKNVKRLEGMMRSPVFTHLGATLQGLTTIRAFGQQATLQAEFDKYQDYHSSAWYMFISTSSSFGFFTNAFCFSFTIIVTLGLLIFGDFFGLKSGEVGLAITQSNSIAGLIQWAMRQSAEVSNQLLSVERILEYKTLPKESQPLVPKIPSKAWPDQGLVIFKNMYLRYFEDGPLVLKNLNFIIKPKEKVGIVGRTGAGKSSLISALFRLAPIEGEINIDNIDTKDINLETLRLKISIIPQDPVLFSGTLRYNLDPFEEYNDETLYKAIQDVELKDPANIINRLENRVSDRGANYSVGQRQLICLARALIRNNKILMLDEATANVDPQTDALIQTTIRQKFVDCTVITVAHRLNTIIDSDKVLVMDAGQVIEYEHPHILLQRPNSVFSKMVEETGPAMDEVLRSQAKETYEKYASIAE